MKEKGGADSMDLDSQESNESAFFVCFVDCLIEAQYPGTQLRMQGFNVVRKALTHFRGCA
jgi:hypothetical protein